MLENQDLTAYLKGLPVKRITNAGEIVSEQLSETEIINCFTHVVKGQDCTAINSLWSGDDSPIKLLLKKHQSNRELILNLTKSVLAARNFINEFLSMIPSEAILNELLKEKKEAQTVNKTKQTLFSNKRKWNDGEISKIDDYLKRLRVIISNDVLLSDTQYPQLLFPDQEPYEDAKEIEMLEDFNLVPNNHWIKKFIHNVLLNTLCMLKLCAMPKQNISNLQSELHLLRVWY